MRLSRSVHTIIALLALGAIAAPADVLYETGFEDFTPGADTLAGTEGWLSTRNDERLHGIDDEIIPGIGKSAYLGFYPPASTQVQTVSVFRPINFDGIAEGRPLIEFEALIAIAASQDDETTPLTDESNRQDRFLITVYNIEGHQLASIIYDNRTFTFGLYRNNGSNSFDTGFEFVIEEPQFLYFSIDLENNTWSATLDGAPLFTDALFNSTGRTLNIGTIAAEWNLTNRFAPGNNWMLFDDWFISAQSRTPTTMTEPFLISKIERTADNKTEFTFPADAGCTYTLQYSSDMKNWTDSTSSPMTASTSDPSAKYVDETAAPGGRLYYRILREPAD